MAPGSVKLSDAYMLWFPLGIFGAHRFYLGSRNMGLLYAFTLGLFGVGWIMDGIFMWKLVAQAMDRMASDAKSVDSTDHIEQADLYTVYVLCICPITGLLGLHHYYLRRWNFGVLYTCTLGLVGIGFIVDLIRLSYLVKRINKERTEQIPKGLNYLDDAYLLLFPFGFLGLHHFYLYRRCWGVYYIFTLGGFVLGWLVDFVRLPMLVRQCNNDYLGMAIK